MDHHDELTEIVLKAKNNDDEINILIQTYKPFIASELSKFQSRSVDSNSDELMTTGMLAFAEAVKSYNQDKGAFITLARTIIRQRVIDHYRKEKLNFSHNIMDVDELEMDEKSINIYHEQIEKEKRIEVIKEYKQELSYWNIDFIELAKASPKSKKLKDIYKEMSRFIHNNYEILDDVKKNKRLPIQLLSAEYGVNRKKIERGRSFIIACIVLRDSKYKSLSDYVE